MVDFVDAKKKRTFFYFKKTFPIIENNKSKKKIIAVKDWDEEELLDIIHNSASWIINGILIYGEIMKL